MKKYAISICISSLIFISGCGWKPTTQIDFDDFTFNLKTDQTYTAAISNNTENEKWIIRKYISKTTSGEINDPFVDSLLIAKVPVERADTQYFVTSNMQDTTESQQIFNISCPKEELTGIRVSFEKVRGTSITYIGQFFIVKDGQGYIVSLGTNIQKERNQLQNSLKTLSCH